MIIANRHSMHFSKSQTLIYEFLLVETDLDSEEFKGEFVTVTLMIGDKSNRKNSGRRLVEVAA